MRLFRHGHWQDKVGKNWRENAAVRWIRGRREDLKTTRRYENDAKM